MIWATWEGEALHGNIISAHCENEDILVGLMYATLPTAVPNLNAGNCFIIQLSINTYL